MSDAFTIAASGLRSAEQVFTAAAFNIVSAANQAPAAPPPPPAPGTAPTAPLDLATQMVAQIEAANAFRANLAVYRTASSMYRALLRAI